MTDQLRLDIFAGLEEAGDLEDRQLGEKVQYLQGFEGGPEGYRLRRIILCNYWLYGLQEFEVVHGRLFLAGENASGKSSVLAAALPLALDGDLRPNRIDTFGGRDRKVEYYVLGGAESSTSYSFERRTTYIALEFEWCAQNQPPFGHELRQKWLEEEGPERDKARWLTIGLSLAGNINATERVRALRFVITDGSRFGEDLHMVDSKNLALDHPAFRRALGEHGVICDTTAEYQSFVARYLFGMDDAKEFQNIMSMLLILRRPNLGSELNFSKVHDFLKQSLRKIPEETTRRVTGTIERIDNIQSQLERLQEAFEAGSELDKASQKLAVAAAQKAGLSFARIRNIEIAAQGRVTGLRRELGLAETERDHAQQRYDELTNEEGQVTGQIAALETSTGLQVAERLAMAREQARMAAARLEQQSQQLEGTRQSVRTAFGRQERIEANWRKLQVDSLKGLSNLRQEAAEKAEWPLAAAQFEESIQQLSALSLTLEQPPRLPVALESLAGLATQERVERLQQLEELHYRREKLAQDERSSREREEEKFADYDQVRQRREAAQETVRQAREELAVNLRQLYKTGKWVSELPEYKFTRLVTGTLRESVEEYRESARQFTLELDGSVEKLRQQQARLLENRGAQNRHRSELEELYRQRLAEPDLLPVRTAARQKARAYLQEAGIPAFPLYALLDFREGILPEQAGRIEKMLQEAGLLDALVLPSFRQAETQNLLEKAGLTDCWLQPGDRVAAPDLADWLVFDPSVLEGQNPGNWLPVVEMFLHSVSLAEVKPGFPGLDSSGKWWHGLLAGYGGAGEAVGFIGAANRRRLRRRELDEIQAKLEGVKAEIENLERQLEQNRRNQQELAQELAQLNELAQAGAWVNAETEMRRVSIELEGAEKVLQEAQSRARETRQQLAALTARILQDSSEIPGAANDPRRVRQLIDATRQLRSDSALLWQVLQAIGGLWQEYHENLTILDTARRSEQLAIQLHTESLGRSVEASAELAELERAAQAADVQELIERLAKLRVRRQELPEARMDARSERDRADERALNLKQNLDEALNKLAEEQEKRAAAQATFAMRLAAYPVPRLTEARLLAEREDYYRAALKILNNSGGMAGLDDAMFEAEYNRAYNHLSAEFNRLRPILAEYGPELDDEGRITFILENQVESPALLESLEHQIDVQKALLGNEESALFEDFLLQEMAEAIRFHIGQTEAWVRRINRVLEDLPMVGERYSLEWKPAEGSDLVEGLGSHIARQHRLLRKPAQQLSGEERQLLLEAFRREIEGLRLLQKEQPGLNFIDSLVQIFDYREWFHFSVFITPQGGNRTRLTDRIVGTRSGAEQLFALYIPLFAALAALYDSATSPGSPRLLALDEAFDKASVANTQRIMEFLVLQDFQWIMTGPQVSGTGSGVPVSAEYQMMHEKGSLVATAVPFFWIAGRELAGKDRSTQED